jgi:hypothetical protein
MEPLPPADHVHALNCRRRVSTVAQLSIFDARNLLDFLIYPLSLLRKASCPIFPSASVAPDSHKIHSRSKSRWSARRVFLRRRKVKSQGRTGIRDNRQEFDPGVGSKRLRCRCPNQKGMWILDRSMSHFYR